MTPLDLRPILDVHVLGTPRPKGSMRIITRNVMKESSATSPEWRSAVVAAAYKAIACGCDDSECRTLNNGYPYTGPVNVLIELEFVAPKKRQPLPSTRTTGDLDKHARNILDALQDAAVLKDDCVVVDLRISKRYSDRGVAGARIVVWPHAGSQIPVPGSTAAMKLLPDAGLPQQGILA